MEIDCDMGTLLVSAVQVRSVVDVIDSFLLQAAVAVDDGRIFFGVSQTDGGHLVKLEEEKIFYAN